MGDETVNYHRNAKLPIALATLADCCHSAVTRSPVSLNEELLAPDALLHMARRHRVQAIALRGMEMAGADLDRHPLLQQDAREILVDNLRAADAAGALSADFHRGGIPHLFVKGLTLSKLGYDDPFIKMSSDIDVLVEQEDIDAAAAVLVERGYRLILPRTSGLQAWHRVHKESLWLSGQGLLVELHSRLADNPDILAGVRADGPTRMVGIQPGLELPTLTPAALRTYLAVHGASSMWFRLKWLADFAALSRREKAAAELPDIDRALRLADSLSAIVFGTDMGRGKRDFSGALLERIALSQLGNPREPSKRRLGTATIHLGQILAMNDLASASREMVRKLSALTLRD